MRILVHADPQPNIQEPWYVKDAYIGLLLDVERSFLGEKAPDRWPNGVYMVRLAIVLKALRAKSLPAYRWLRNAKQGTDDLLREHGDPTGVQVPFPTECCEEIPEMLH